MAPTLHGRFTVPHLLKEILTVIQGTDVTEVGSSVRLCLLSKLQGCAECLPSVQLSFS
jgi:hypothetical protein